ncbi:MAG: 3'(2'),5'-bisphosphate nucleotidase CysQ [Pseudomonadota bacterium]
MPVSDHHDDLELMTHAAEGAGNLALKFFGNNPKTWIKGKDSSVSEADMAADAYLKDMLCAARPNYGWLSEETVDTEHRLQKKRIFIADPIDGTRGFLSGNADWCVSLAMIEDGVPQAAVLYAPALKKIYTAQRGHGAFCDGQKLDGGAKRAANDYLIAGTPLEKEWASFTAYSKAAFIPSLALRLARVASGELTATFSRANAHDWDIAGAHLLVEEAGGLFVDGKGTVPRYNRVQLTHPPLAAFSAHVRDELEAKAS